MSQKKLIDQLNNLCIELDDKYNINNGGCCYIAAVMARYLTQYNIPYQLVEYDYGSHYAIKTKYKIINRCDFHKDYRTRYYDYSVWRIYDLYYTNDWNCMYEIKNNGIVTLLIRNLFKKYERSKNH